MVVFMFILKSEEWDSISKINPPKRAFARETERRERQRDREEREAERQRGERVDKSYEW